MGKIVSRLFCMGLAATVLCGCRGRHQEPGEITAARVPQPVVTARAERQTEAVERLVERFPPQATERRTAKQILFGDLHVHTTFSVDAFGMSLPLMQGEGVHPPADACDFARYCSDLDFWSITDHAEGISPRHWREIKETIRRCNSAAGDPANPDTVAFTGWEWTQVGTTPENHYGHKNVIFRDTGEDQLPTRPISARSGRLVGAMLDPPPFWQRLTIPLLDFSNRQQYFDFGRFQRDMGNVPLCPEGVDTRELPPDCHERARTPRALFEKLSQWGFDTLVIPHGTTWGLYTPPGTTFDHQLTPVQHDPEQQTLFEIYSGHGNSEEYRSWRAVAHDEQGAPSCPAPTDGYLPCCWQAGEIIRSRCADPSSEQCARRVEEARQNYVEGGVSGHLTVPGATMTDWKDCGQCRDCFAPAFNYRPASSAQYTLAIRNFEDPDKPLGFRFGLIASSDNHTARPGTGYKEYARRMMTEATGPRDKAWRDRLAGPLVGRDPVAESVPLSEVTITHLFQRVEGERQASFFLTGGLVAVHAAGRDHEAIWQALKRREVYGTSGGRILLWFDLLDSRRDPLPMGSEVALGSTPRFRVRAIGSFRQEPGCPPHSLHALGAERLEHLCRGECYNPSDERKVIARIEVVRIRPRQHTGEAIESLIDDPWRRFECPSDPAGCTVEFEDPDFLRGQRETIYYVRAVEERSLAVNAGGLRGEYDKDGVCTAVQPCYGDYRTPFDDDCVGPIEERAWSSPIFVTPVAGAQSARPTGGDDAGRG